MNLFARFFLILLAFALFPVLVLGVWIFSSTAAVRDNARSFHQELASITSDSVDSYVAEMNRSLAFVEDLERDRKQDSARDFRTLQRAAAVHSSFLVLSILDPVGHEVMRLADPNLYPLPEFADRSREPAVQEMRLTGRIALGRPRLVKGMPILPIAHPLPNGRMLYVEYSLRPLWQRINKLKVGASGRLMLVDAGGQPLPGMSPGAVPSWKKSPFSGPSGWLERIRTSSGTMVGAFSAAPSLGVWALSLQPRAEAYSHSERFVEQAAAFLLLLSLLVGTGAFWITGRLTKPLNLLIAGARRAGQGDLKQPVPEVGWGELSVLARTFNQMMKTVRDYQAMQVERIIEEKARVAALVHNIPAGIIMAGFGGEIVYANAMAALILGAPELAGPSAGRNIRDVIRSPQLLELTQSLIMRRKRSDSVEVELTGSDGSNRGVFLCQGVTVSGEKRDIGILLLLRDVTMERNVERMKEEFLHSIVHDLRSPLSAISAFIETMQKSAAVSEKERMYMRYAAQATARLRDLVSDILQMAKLESGTMELKKSIVDVQGILDSMRDLYTIQAEPRKIALDFVRGSAPHALSCDSGLVERVVMNLIGNAMKFTPEGGKITVEIGTRDGEMEFSVQDTGPGIPKMALKSVFEKFKQLEGGQMRQGYGLGLAICKKVVELHGGRIWVESEEGRGSRFIFRLPLN